MLQAIIHAWERRLAAVTTDRVVRPFDWGLEWIPPNGHIRGGGPAAILHEWVADVMTDTDRFFTPLPTSDYTIAPTSVDGERLLTFPSALDTPHTENNTVYGRLFPAPGRKAAVLVLPQWNSDAGGHV